MQLSIGSRARQVYSKLSNVLSPPEPSLREIAQSFILTKNNDKGEPIFWVAAIKAN